MCAEAASYVSAAAALSPGTHKKPKCIERIMSCKPISWSTNNSIGTAAAGASSKNDSIHSSRVYTLRGQNMQPRARATGPDTQPQGRGRTPSSPSISQYTARLLHIELRVVSLYTHTHSCGQKELKTSSRRDSTRDSGSGSLSPQVAKAEYESNAHNMHDVSREREKGEPIDN